MMSAYFMSYRFEFETLVYKPGCRFAQDKTMSLTALWIFPRGHRYAKRSRQVGVDVPLSLKQQHALNLLPNRGDHPDEAKNRDSNWGKLLVIYW